MEHKILPVEWLDLVSNHTQEGYQFYKAFEGIGGILLRKGPGDDGDDSEDGETDHDDGEILDDALLNFWDDL